MAKEGRCEIVAAAMVLAATMWLAAMVLAAMVLAAFLAEDLAEDIAENFAEEGACLAGRNMGVRRAVPLWRCLAPLRLSFCPSFCAAAINVFLLLRIDGGVDSK